MKTKPELIEKMGHTLGADKTSITKRTPNYLFQLGIKPYIGFCYEGIIHNPPPTTAQEKHDKINYLYLLENPHLVPKYGPPEGIIKDSLLLYGRTIDNIARGKYLNLRKKEEIVVALSKVESLRIVLQDQLDYIEGAENRS